MYGTESSSAWPSPAPPGPAASWAMPVQPPPPPGPVGRPPSAHECDLCGFLPAQRLRIHQTIGMVVVFQHTNFTGDYCRMCGNELLRKAQNLTVIAGWWGLISLFATLLILVSNTVSFLRVRRMPRPLQRDPMVVTPNPFPLPDGSPLLARPGIWVLACLVTGLVVVTELA